MLFVTSSYEAFRCLMTKGEKCTLKTSKWCHYQEGGMENAMQKDAWWYGEVLSQYEEEVQFDNPMD